MRYMLDTNILIYLIKNKPPSVAARVNRLAAGDSLCMSFFTWSELQAGAEGSADPAKTRVQLDALARQIPVLNLLPPSMALHYAVHFQRLKRTGRPIGANDLWIACHALSEGVTLVTRNLREFGRIEGLPLENWAD